ncbi:glycosyltransferase [Marinobacter sp. ATCH36]|uniref:glycosyltransferase n=1 Tax=Marinobacter sp. ATCH36 TaxID=2945106 RepID=UPI00202226EF|nr:glycosyltransferase [Marinobacter sp. ATCH36]MCL7945143.1 glycosyltransferase [Marinobacter sp. ATCH36]
MKKIFSSEVTKPKEIDYEGCIDVFKDGHVTGWAWCPSAPEESLDLEVVTKSGKILGRGMASGFREDLKKQDIGTGKYGFSIKISIPDGEENLELMLLESSSRKMVSAKPLTLENLRKFEISFEHIEWSHLRGTIHAPSLEDESIGLILTNEHGEKVGESGAVLSDSGIYKFNIALPTIICDGNFHALTVSTVGGPIAEATYLDVFPNIQTPWEHLVGSAKELNYAALSKTAGYRYASLRKQLEEISQMTDAAEARVRTENVICAHDLVVEGWQGRKKYPKLKLPKVANPDVTIVIPVHNKFELTYHALASIILAWNKASFEVVVVDDCSTDKTTELADIVENVDVIVNEQNLGFLRNCNKAAREAKGQYLVMLNNDTEVTSGWLDEQIATFARFDDVGMTGSKLIYPNGVLQEAGGIVWDKGNPWNLGNGQNAEAPEWNYARQADYLSGASLMIPTKVWEEVGGFSDEFAPAYYEDTDLAFKIRDAGFKTVYVPHSVVVHFEGMSNGRDLTQGIKKNQAINAPKFRAKWVDAYMGNGQAYLDNVRFNKDRNVAYRVLMIDYAVPRPDHDAGSYAAIQEMRMLQANGCKVSFVAENMAHMGKYTDNLHRMGIETFYAPFSTSIDQVLHERGDEFDIVYITRYDVAERHLPTIRKYTKAKVLFNNADLHFLRELRAALAAKKSDLSGPLATRDRELTLMRKVDGILSYNPTEHAVILSHNLKGDNLFICPWVLDGRGHKTPFEKRAGIGFLGGFKHLPNIEAVEFFVETVMPLLRKQLPGAKFHVYGSGMPENFKKFEADDVILEGFVENLDEVFETHRVIVAPLLSGAGIKGKVLEGMSSGVPQVLSPVAAEATGLTHGVSAMIVEEPQAWVDAIKELYENEERWQQISENALALARNNFSLSNGIKGMKGVLEGIGVYPPNRIRALLSA